MDKIFTITEHRLIRSLLASKTNAQISGIIDCSTEQITDYISKLLGVGQRPEKKMPKPVKEKTAKKKPVTLKQLAKKSELGKKQKEEKKARKIARQMDEHHKARRKREERRAFKTIPFDPTGKIQVRLNSKTQVWVRPGTDIAKLKVLYKIKD